METTDETFVPVTVELAPDRRRAATWTVVGLVATSLAAFALSRAMFPIWPLVLVVASALVTATYGLQLLAPESWTLRVDRRGLEGTVASFRVAEDFAPLRAVELSTWLGEPVLVLLTPTRTRRLLLPVGCDVTKLREVVDEVAGDKARGL